MLERLLLRAVRENNSY